MRPLCSFVVAATLAVLLFASCGDRTRQDNALLATADSLLRVIPGSALSLADSLLATGRGRSHWMMQLRLRRLNAQNKLDTVFTSRHVDEAKTLTEHFDRHGTPNERMLAHYLLGRTYADTHEAPMALEAFHDAVDCADTTAADCDYATLMRVYGQMATLFLTQDSPQNALEQMTEIDKYAHKLKDTLMILVNQEHMASAYCQMGKPDSEIVIREKVSQQYSRLGLSKMAARALGPTINDLVEKGDYVKAKGYLHTFEQLSGVVDSNFTCLIESKAYYYNKGLIFLEENKLDSAEFFFRKAICDVSHINNLEIGYRGLALLYQKTNDLDSAVKYAMLAYNVNDSSYRQSASDYYQKMQSLYSYTRNQQLASQKSRENERLQYTLLLACLIVVCVLFAFYAMTKAYKEKRDENRRLQQEFHEKYMAFRQAEMEYSLLVGEKENAISAIEKDSAEKQLQIESLNRQIFNLEQKKEELYTTLSSRESQIEEAERVRASKERDNKQLNFKVNELSGLISSLKKEKLEYAVLMANNERNLMAERGKWSQILEEKEVIIKEQEQQIASFVKNDKLRQLASEENELLNASITKTFGTALAKNGTKISQKHWKELHQLIQTHAPNFFPTIIGEYPQVRDEELKVCMLIRLNFPLKHISSLLDISLQNLNNIRRRLQVKIFHQEGSAKDFDKKILLIR